MELFDKVSNYFKKDQTSKSTELSGNAELADQPQDNLTVNDGQSNNNEEITVGTKIKVVAALALVGFAGYVAYWIQEPIQLKADILGSNSSMQAESQQSTQEISIANFNFDPATVNVAKGTTVVWTNKDTVPHNVVGDNFSSPTLNPGESYSYTFNADGSFAYKCTFHPQMKGFVIVGTPSKDQVLNGFGAGNSLALESDAAADTSVNNTDSQVMMTESSSQQIAEELTTTSAPVAENTTPEAEKIFTTSAPAPASTLVPGAVEDDLHGAALQPLSASLSNVGTAATGSQSGTDSLSGQNNAQTNTASAEALAAANQAQASGKGKLANSGPEDYIYAGIFGVVLYMNRKKLLKALK